MFEFLRWFATFILFPTVTLGLLIIQAFENLKESINGGQAVTVVHVIERPLQGAPPYPAHHPSPPSSPTPPTSDRPSSPSTTTPPTSGPSSPSTISHAPTPPTPPSPSTTTTPPYSPITTAISPAPSLVGSEETGENKWVRLGVWMVCSLVLLVVYSLIGNLVPNLSRILLVVLWAITESVVSLFCNRMRISRRWRRAHQQMLETAMAMDMV